MRWIIYLRIVAFISSAITPRDTVPVQSRWRRRIVTPIPVPESIPVIERLRAVEPVSMSAMPPVLWDEAEGFLVRDPYGNQWIDLTSAIVMANAGHSHPRIVEAIHRAADGKLLATYAFPATGRSAVLEKLVSLSPIPDSKAILFSAGTEATEATEAAMFVMWLHGRAIDPEKVGILSFAAGYHGRTLAASMAAGTPRPDDWISRGQLHHYQIFPFRSARLARGDTMLQKPAMKPALSDALNCLTKEGSNPNGSPDSSENPRRVGLPGRFRRGSPKQ